MSITSSESQRSVTVVRFGLAISAARASRPKIVVETAMLLLPDLDGRAVAGTYVHRIYGSRHLPAPHHLCTQRRRDGGNERASILRKSTLDVVDEIGSPAEPLDAKLKAGLVDRIAGPSSIGPCSSKPDFRSCRQDPSRTMS